MAYSTSAPPPPPPSESLSLLQVQALEESQSLYQVLCPRPSYNVKHSFVNFHFHFFHFFLFMLSKVSWNTLPGSPSLS